LGASTVKVKVPAAKLNTKEANFSIYKVLVRKMKAKKKSVQLSLWHHQQINQMWLKTKLKKFIVMLASE
jgi:hypothetical protein